MGGPTDMLVVVATMYDNPKGLTKEQVVDIFQNKINIKKNSWGAYGWLKFEDHGFAHLFNLKNNQEYLENRKKYWNEDYKYPIQKELIWPEMRLNVIHREHKSLGKTILKYKGYNNPDERKCEGYKEGKYIFKGHFDEIIISKEYEDSKNEYLVRKVFNTDIKNYDEETSEINQELEVEVVQFKSKNFKFNSLKELVKKYPEYSAERVYDFNQKQGNLYPYPEFKNYPPFKWIKKQDKYFLDFDNFSRIINANSYFTICNFQTDWLHENQKNKSKFSLTDVVLTSEAIRRRNWKALGYNTMFHFSRDFAYSNETTLRKYEKAIFDTEISVQAQKENWTNFEFLREHQFNNLTRTIVPYKEIKEMLKQENKEKGIIKRKDRLERKKQELLNPPKPEIPF